LLGLNLFSGPGQRLVPAPANRPGFDGSVFFDDGSSLMVSIKNHGISSHESAFLSKAAEIRQYEEHCGNEGRMEQTSARDADPDL